jgi:hypothetical protein
MYMIFALFWEQWCLLFLFVSTTKKVVPLFFFRNHAILLLPTLCVLILIRTMECTSYQFRSNMHVLWQSQSPNETERLFGKLHIWKQCSLLLWNRGHCPHGRERGLQCFSRCLTPIPFILYMVKMKRRLWECWFRWGSDESEPTAATHSSQLGMPSKLHIEIGHEDLRIRSELWCHLV